MNVRERVVDVLAEVVAELLRDDLRRVLLGEDVRDGGMLGLSRAAMRDPALGLRVLATPLTPATNLAHATGLALAGRRPIVLLNSATALLEGYAALRELGRDDGAVLLDRDGAAGERLQRRLVVGRTALARASGEQADQQQRGAVAHAGAAVAAPIAAITAARHDRPPS